MRYHIRTSHPVGDVRYNIYVLYLAYVLLDLHRVENLLNHTLSHAIHLHGERWYRTY